MMKNMLKKMMVIGVGSMLLMGSSVSAAVAYPHEHRDDNVDHICDDENCKESLFELRRVIPATCTNDGHTEFRCIVCGEVTTGEIFPATGHKDTDNDHYCNNIKYDDVICNKKISECSGGTATCVSQAVCDICKKPYGEEDSDNHVGKMVTLNNKEATCEEDGYSGDTYCESCNNVVETGSELPRLGHIDEDTNHICDRETCGKVLSECTGGEATCKDLAVCEYCGHEYGEKDISKHVGDTEIRDAKPATCCEDGYTGDTYCTSCDAKLLDGTVIPALGHIDIPETETETETEKQTETETESITEPVTEKETEKQTETEKQPETTKQTEAPKPVTPATEKIVETESAYPVAPQTGDDTPFAAVAGLLVGSGAILAGGVAIKRRRK